MKLMIYSVWHQRLFREMMRDVPEDQRHQITVYGVNEKIEKEFPDFEDPDFRGYKIMLEYQLPIYEPIWQRKVYCQTSCLMHLFTNRIPLSESMDYIGWCQYDMKIDKDTLTHVHETVAAQPGKQLIFHEMTLSIPEALGGQTGWHHVLSHYNTFFNKQWTWDSIMAHPRIPLKLPLVHTFIIPVSMFQKMMSWMSTYLRLIEETGYPSNISQAEFGERLHGLFLALELEDDNTIMLPCKIRHIWPDLHNQVPWENYKVRV